MTTSRRWWRLALAMLAGGILWHLLQPLASELRGAAELFTTARWEWVGVALVAQITSYVCLAWLNALALRPFPGHIGLSRLAAVMASLAFIEVAVPTAGLSGVALRAHLLGRHGYSFRAALVSLLVETWLLVVALTGLAGVGLVALVRAGELTPGAAAGLGTLAAGLLLGAAAAVPGLRHLSRQPRWVARLAALWNRLTRDQRRLSPAALTDRLATFDHELAGYRQVPLRLWLAAVGGRVLLDLLTLWACFLTVADGLSPGQALTGYGLLWLASLLSALPAGPGLSDASLPVIFSSLGVPGRVALAAPLLYRLLSAWLWRIGGYFAWQLLTVDRPGEPLTAPSR